MVAIKMNENKAHPLLAQVPLTVSPFIQLPSAVTLPYTYKTLPSALPPSATGSSGPGDKPKYVVSASGHAEHPDDILAQCKALHAYIDKAKNEAEKEVKEWEERIKARELAEKRRVAPGWLDSDMHLLEPAKRQAAVGSGQSTSIMDVDASSAEASRLGESLSDQKAREGKQIDEAFGGLEIR